jgi:hypothetical protein
MATVRRPIEPDARLGYVMASLIWVLLIAGLTFGHHYYFGGGNVALSEGVSTFVGGSAAFKGWLPHSAIGYLLLITIGVDAFVEIRSKEHIDSKKAFNAIAACIILMILAGICEIFFENYLGQFIVWTALVMAAFILKYHMLREYKW